MQPCYRYLAELDRVVDGDTLDILIALGFYIRIKERIKLEGVDTPEIYGVPQDSEEYRSRVKVHNAGGNYARIGQVP